METTEGPIGWTGKKVWYVCIQRNVIHHQKERKSCICNNTDREHDANSEKERQILYDFTSMWNLKKKLSLLDTEHRLMVVRCGGGENG